MFNTSVLCPVLILLSASRIIFSIPVPDDYLDKLPSILASPELDNYSEELISTSTITHTSPVPEEVTTELQNAVVCETANHWAECEAFLEAHLNRDSEEYRQLQNLKYPYTVRNWNHSFPLPQEAAISGYTELIEVLLRNGLPVNKKYSSLKQTLLYFAINNEKTDLVTFLLTQGADVQVKNLAGNTPLHVAASNFESTIVNLLVDAGANVNVSNNNGETPLFQTVDNLSPIESNDILTREELAEYENMIFVDGNNIIKLLLEHGADVNTANILGETPLHAAAKNGNLTIVKVLVDRAANINATDIDNQTPLHKATESNNVSIVKYLIAMGCDKTITDANKKTALDIAEEKNFTEIVDLLNRES